MVEMTYAANEKSIERFLLGIYALYTITLMLISDTNQWAGVNNTIWFSGLLIAGFIYIGKYKTYVFRMKIFAVLMQISVVLYATHADRFQDAIPTFMVFVVLLGLTGIEGLVYITVGSLACVFSYHIWITETISTENLPIALSQLANVLLLQYSVYSWTKRNRLGTGTSTYVGGITGSVSQATSTLTNSYNLGDITGTTNCAGVAGYNHKSAVIENVFSLGTITGNKVAACIGGTTAKDKALNLFATQEYDIILGQSTVTSDQMASGEVAYLLGEAFGQLIDTDTHPVLGGERVYKVTYTTNLSADVDSLYTNGALPQFEDVEGHQTIWKTSLDGEELTEVSADSTLYVEYHKITYALIYIVDGEVYATDSIEYGAAITPIAEPVKEGYTFSGWSEVPETMPASDVTISGTYTVNIYKVYYYVGDELVHTAEVAYGDTIPEYVYEPTVEGDVFFGWVGDTYETMPAHDVTYTANIASDVLQLTIHNSQLTIHDLSGRKVTDTENLKRGIYIVNGKKVIVK